MAGCAGLDFGLILFLEGCDRVQRRGFHFDCLAFILVLAGITGQVNAEPAWTEPLAPFFKEYCLGCHAGEIRKGGLDLERLGTELADPELLRRWVRIYDRVAGGEMPPGDEPRPERDAAREFLSRLSDSLTRADAVRRQTVLKRLHRVEYENTVRDLFGIRVDVKETLPKDPSAHAFDTVGDVLALSPEQQPRQSQFADHPCRRRIPARPAPVVRSAAQLTVAEPLCFDAAAPRPGNRPVCFEHGQHGRGRGVSPP